jgi:hypothetical protein
VQLGDQAAQLHVDTQLDQAIVSDPRLLLRYPSTDNSYRQVVSHAVQVGREIGVSDVFLVNAGKQRVELIRVQVVQGRLVGRVELPWSEQRGFTKVALDQAIATLAEARIEGQPSVDSTPTSPPEVGAVSVELPLPLPLKPVPSVHPRAPKTDVKDKSPAPSKASRQDGRWQRIVGGTSLVLGTASFAGSATASLKRRARAEQFARSLPGTNDYGARYVAWKDARSLPYAFASGGSFLAAMGTVSLALSFRFDSIPWWTTMLSGIAGIGLATWGIVDVAEGGSCGTGFDLRSCSRAQELRDRGGLLLLASVPFFALPLTQLTRRALGAGSRSTSRAFFYAASDLQQRELLLTATF